jgi:hypothetical protein
MPTVAARSLANPDIALRAASGTAAVLTSISTMGEAGRPPAAGGSVAAMRAAASAVDRPARSRPRIIVPAVGEMLVSRSAK